MHVFIGFPLCLILGLFLSSSSFSLSLSLSLSLSPLKKRGEALHLWKRNRPLGGGTQGVLPACLLPVPFFPFFPSPLLPCLHLPSSHLPTHSPRLPVDPSSRHSLASFLPSILILPFFPSVIPHHPPFPPSLLSFPFLPQDRPQLCTADRTSTSIEGRIGPASPAPISAFLATLYCIIYTFSIRVLHSDRSRVLFMACRRRKGPRTFHNLCVYALFPYINHIILCYITVPFLPMLMPLMYYVLSLYLYYTTVCLYIISAGIMQYSFIWYSRASYTHPGTGITNLQWRTR